MEPLILSSGDFFQYQGRCQLGELQGLFDSVLSVSAVHENLLNQDMQFQIAEEESCYLQDGPQLSFLRQYLTGRHLDQVVAYRSEDSWHYVQQGGTLSIYPESLQIGATNQGSYLLQRYQQGQWQDATQRVTYRSEVLAIETLDLSWASIETYKIHVTLYTESLGGDGQTHSYEKITWLHPFYDAVQEDVKTTLGSLPAEYHYQLVHSNRLP